MRIILRKYSILLFTLVVVFVIVNFQGTETVRKVFIDGDGSGHYAYLPSLLIFHSVDFEEVFQFEKHRRPPDYTGHNFLKKGDILINKYTVGTALLQLPFFIVGLLLSLLFGFAPDGYNIIFQYCIAFSTLFWVGIGIIYFIKLLVTYGVDRKFAWVMAIISLFGTNLFFYTFIQPSFTHAYSFTLITIFLYFCRRVFLDYEKRYVLAAAFLLGLIVLVRPVNILVVASLPFIAGTPHNFMNSIKRKLSDHHYILAILVFLLAISPQLIINYLQTGTLIIYGYENEGFYFSNPQIFDFLFGYRKGWFVYSPMFLLLFPAIINIWRRQSAYAFFTFILFILILVYIFSAWWNWFFGDSFGMRPMVDYYGLFMLVIALQLHQLKSLVLKIGAVIFVCLVILLNLVQSYQYNKGIIHPDSMSKKSYWHVFMKMDREYISVIAGGDESFYGKLSDMPFFSTQNQIDYFDEGWTTSNLVNKESAFSDSLSVIQNAIQIYSPTFSFNISDSLIGYNNIFVRFNTHYYEMEQNAALSAVFVVDISDTTGNTVFYKAFRIKHLPDDSVSEWKMGSIGFKLPEIKGNMAYIKFYIWNIEKQTYLLDDLSMKFYTYNSD
ncbi:MAG: hypothetical protein H8E34_08480 [Bacteroidetes bacterium]|nr:hypothetical protein [Bacteroidota bacterium]